VLYGKIECFLFALRRSGSFSLCDINKKMICGGKTYKKLKFLERARGKIEVAVR